ncbi:hypothetical protein F5Y01DRAFT_206131 [Xylaria sp. FL0043]|nr:hypothetical protein F5Y01DRAFT_206131 [Xylaria sp. FL0043]
MCYGRLIQNPSTWIGRKPLQHSHHTPNPLNGNPRMKKSHDIFDSWVVRKLNYHPSLGVEHSCKNHMEHKTISIVLASVVCVVIHHTRSMYVPWLAWRQQKCRYQTLQSSKRLNHIDRGLVVIFSSAVESSRRLRVCASHLAKRKISCQSVSCSIAYTYIHTYTYFMRMGTGTGTSPTECSSCPSEAQMPDRVYVAVAVIYFCPFTELRRIFS